MNQGFTSFHWRRLAALLTAIYLCLSVPQTVAQDKRVVAVDLFVVERIVEQRTRAERVQAARSGLAEVFVRVSGNQNVIAEFPLLKSALGRANEWVRSYQYVERDGFLTPDELRNRLTKFTDPGVLLIEDAADDSGAFGLDENSNESTKGMSASELPVSLALVLRFAENNIVDLLKQAGAPIWQAMRPAVLLEIRDSTSTASVELQAERRQAIELWVKQQALARGIEVTVLIEAAEPERPGFSNDARRRTDESYSYARDANDGAVPGDFTMSVQASRFHWLIQLDLGQSNKGLLASWNILELSGDGLAPKLQAASENGNRTDAVEALPDILSEVVSNMGDLLASRYALGAMPFATQQTDVLIKDIRQPEDYLSLELLLRQSSVFEGLKLVEANSQYLRYRLTASSDVQTIRSLLELTGKLKVLESTGDGLVFSWTAGGNGADEDSDAAYRYRKEGDN